MKSMIRTILSSALIFSSYANASSITTINLDSTVYGPFSNSIDELVDSSSSYFLGRGSGYSFTGNIVFTESSGLIKDVLSTNNDNYYWSWNDKQNSLIGTQAVASAMNRVEMLNGNVLTSYMDDINAMNGNRSFCCGSPAVLDIATAGSAALIPEPETYALMLAGLGVLGFVARRRRKTM